MNSLLIEKIIFLQIIFFILIKKVVVPKLEKIIILFLILSFINILEDDFPFFSAYYDITKEGNYKGKNILNLIDKDLELDEFFKTKNQIIKQKLVKYSNQKSAKPSISKTINAGNNALFSTSLSYAGNKFKDIELIKLSQNIIDFLLSHFKYNKNELILFKYSNLKKL